MWSKLARTLLAAGLLGAGLLGAPGQASAIPLITSKSVKPRVRNLRGCNKKCREKRAAQARVKSLREQLTMVRELKRWARDVYNDLRRTHDDSLSNLKRAREAIARAKNQKPTPYNQPRGLEAQLIIATSSRKVPQQSHTIPQVGPDDVYLHCVVSFPEAWVKAGKKVRVRWYLFDERHLPTAASWQTKKKAIYYKFWSPRAIRANKVDYYERVSGLGLLPGRYFAAMKIELAEGSYPRPKQIALGVFRVVGASPPGVVAVLPHYPGWYSSYKPVVKLDGVKAKAKGQGDKSVVLVSGKLERQDYKRGESKPVYIEVLAESGYRKRVIYRDRVKLGRKGKARLRLKIKEHGLSPGPYQLKVTAYTEYLTGTRYKYPRGSYAFVRVPVKVN